MFHEYNYDSFLFISLPLLAIYNRILYNTYNFLSSQTKTFSGKVLIPNIQRTYFIHSLLFILCKNVIHPLKGFFEYINTFFKHTKVVYQFANLIRKTHRWDMVELLFTDRCIVANNIMKYLDIHFIRFFSILRG